MKAKKYEANLKSRTILKTKDLEVVEVFNAAPSNVIVKVEKIKYI